MTSLKVLNVAWFFLSDGSLAGPKAQLLPLHEAAASTAFLANFTHHADAEVSPTHSTEIAAISEHIMTYDVFSLHWPTAQTRNVSQAWPSRYYLQSF